MNLKKREDAITRRIDKANNLFDNFKRKEAFAELLNLQNEFPDNSEVLFGLAVLHNSSKQQETAINILKHILILDSKHEPAKCILPVMLYEYAVQLSETGKKELAKKYLLDFIELDNGNKADLANGFMELAVVEESLGNLANAKKYIKKAIEINSTENNEYSELYSKIFHEILNRINGN